MIDQETAGVVFKPGKQAVLHYIWDGALIFAGVGFLFFTRNSILGILVGIITIIVGFWMFFTTRFVLNQRYILNSIGITVITSGGTFGLQWSEINRVVIRSRKMGMIPGRADCLVQIFYKDDQMVSLVTSILTPEDETMLINTIQEKAGSRVEFIQDGPLVMNAQKDH